MLAFNRAALAAALALCAYLPSAPVGQAQEPVTLRFGVGAPPQVHFNKDLFVPWAKKVEEESGGTLKIQMFFSGTLGKEGQLIEMVETGAADIGLDIPVYYPGRFPLTDMAALPLLVTGARESSMALWDTYEKGLLGPGFEDIKVLALTTVPSGVWMTTERRILAPEDLQGMKIAGGGSIKGQIIQKFGAASIQVKAGDVYQSLSRGLVGGAINFYTAIAPFKLNEVVKYYTDGVPLGGSVLMIVMNKDKYDSLPEKARAALDANTGASLSEAFGTLWDKQNAIGQKIAVDSGGEILRPTDEQVAAWTQALQPIVAEWASTTSGGQALIDAFLAARDAAKN